MRVLNLILMYATSVFVMVVGVLMLIGSGGAIWSLASVVGGLLILPPIYERILKKVPSKKPVLLSAVGLVLAGLIGVGNEEGEKRRALEAQAEADKIQSDIRFFNSNRESVMSDIVALIDSKNYKAAELVIKRYSPANDDQLNRLWNAVAAAIQAEKKLAEIDNLKQQIDALGDVESEDALKLYDELAALDPAGDWKDIAASLRPKIERKKNIESQFSAWDGSHYGMERMVKASMHDPDSYEHVETVYWDLGNKIKVRTVFRGKNAFNATVKGSAEALYGLDGTLIAVLSD